MVEYVHPPQTSQNSYKLIYFGHKTLFSPNLMIIILSTLETPYTIANDHISHRFISLLYYISPLSLALSHNYANDE